jgi:hypothetical protein
VVPWPAGATNVVAICVVDGYITDGDDDMAWHCGWRWERNQARFTLSTDYASKGIVSATAILVDTGEFELVNGIEFTVYDNQAWIRYQNGAEYWLGVPSTIQLPMPAGSIPIISITDYETNEDDDFGYAINDLGNGYFRLNAFAGNDFSCAHGTIQVLRPRVSGARAEVSYDWRSNGQNYERSVPGLIWSGRRTLAFSSMNAYAPNDDDDYQVASIVVTEDDGRGGVVLTNRFWTNMGNSGSSAGVQVVALQR